MAPMSEHSKGILQMIKNESAIKVIGDSLERHLTDLQNAADEKAVVELITIETVHLINTFEALKHSSCQESLFGIIDKVIDIFVAVNEAGKEAKRCLILAVTESCMDLIISSTVILIHKIEIGRHHFNFQHIPNVSTPPHKMILKCFNTVLENCSATTKSDLLSRVQCTEKLSLLCKSISQVGDYEVQVCIIEFMFRLVPKSMRKEYFKNMKDDYKQWQDFLDIQDSCFEIDCRRFLNKLNKQNTCPMTRVYSYPAEFISIDGVKLQKPSDDGYDYFWVDFNEGSRRIGIFCEPNSLSSQQSQNVDHLWETVSVWAQDVKKYTCSAQGKLWKAVIELKPGTEMLSNKEPDNLSHLITIAVHQEYDLKSTLANVLKINKKTSSVDNPICIVQKQDTLTTSATSLSNYPHACNRQTSSQQQGNGSVISGKRSKTSIPSEPMTSPASSIITDNSKHPILWQELQERQKRQKEELAKVFGTSGFEVKGKTRLKEDEVKGKEVSTLENLDAFSITTNTSFDKLSHHGVNNTVENSSELNSNKLVKNVRGAPDNVENIQTDKKKDKASERQCRNRSQTKVSVSEKCTDMPWHHVDARASDAVENVVNSSMTDEGDNNSCLQPGQKKHSSRIQYTKCGPKVAHQKITQNIQEQNASEHGKDINSNSQLAESIVDTNVDSKYDCQPKILTKSLKSKKRISSPVSGKTTILDPERIQGDSNPSQLDVILGTLPGAQQPGHRQLRGKRKTQNTQKSKTEGASYDDEVLEPTASIVHEEMKSEKKKKKSKQNNNKRKKSCSKNNTSKVLTDKSNIQNTISPGSTSVEDFKPSKNFRSLRSTNRKVAGKIDNITAISQIKTNENRIRRDQENRTLSKHISGTGDGDFEDSGAKTLKDFLPSLGRKKNFPLQIERNEIAVEIEDAAVDAGNLSDFNALCSVPCSKVKETIKTTDGEKSKELKSVDNKNSMLSEVMSHSSSGELIVEASKGTEEDCNVIKETQFELSPPFSFDDFDITDKDKTQKSFHCPQQSEKSSKKSKPGSKFPNASGDYISSHLDIQKSSNIQSSYIFGKHTDVTASSVKSHHVEFEKRMIESDNTKFKSHNSRGGNVMVKEGYNEKNENSMLVQKNTNPGSPTELDKHERFCVKKTIKNTKEFSQASSSAVVMNTLSTTKVKKKHEQILSKSVEVAVPARKLRARNKTVSYKECGSDCISYDTGKVKIASQKIKKNKTMSPQNIMSGNSAIPVWNSDTEISPSERMKKSQERYSVSLLGAEAPKKCRKSYETNRQIWTSHRMERTVTTMSYAKSVYSLSSDPYDFEAECKKRSEETPVIAPLQSSFFMKHSCGDKIRAESGGGHYRKQGADKSQLQSSCSKKLLIKNATVKDASTQKVKQKRNLSPQGGNKHCSKSGSKKNIVTDSAVVRQTLANKENKQIPFESTAPDSDRGSSKFALFASQYEPDTLDTGLVFPHLDDSIPCTPIHEDTVYEDPNTTEKRSVVSDLSWLTQAKKLQGKKEEKKGKTYKRSTSAKVKNLAACKDEDFEFGPQYSSLYCKQASNTPGISKQTPKPKKKDGTPSKHKLFSPLDIRTFGKSSSMVQPEFTEQSGPLKNNSLIKDCEERILTSVFKNSVQKLNSLQERKTQRRLSFKSPGIKDNSGSELNESLTEDNNYSVNKFKNKKSNLNKSDSEKSSLSTPNLKQHSIDSYSLISSKVDQQLKDVIKRLCGNEDYLCYSGTKSGPSSYIRPTRSELKRKYPNVSSTTNSGGEESDTEDNISNLAESGRKPTYIPRKLFKSDMTDVRSDQSISSVNQARKVVKGQTDTQITNCKFPFQALKKICNEKETLFGPSSKTKSSEKKWETFKYFSSTGKTGDKVTSTPQIEYELVPSCSEGERLLTEPSRKQVFRTENETSPLLPLDLSSSNSPITGFCETSSSHPDSHKHVEETRSTLLDSVRKELKTTALSQFSEEPEETVDTGTLDFSETVSMEFDSLKEFLLKKRTKKTPLDGDELQGTVKSIHQHISSLWETEQSKRINAIEKFHSVAKDVFIRMNKDLKEIHESEVKATLLWTQEMEKIKKYSLFQEKELNRLKSAHDALISELQKIQAESETAQKPLKTAMKQDLNALQKKLFAKYNEHALEAMKRCLQMSLFS